MTKEEVMKRRLERAAERERLVRKNYMLQCRRMIDSQISHWKELNGYKQGYHLDHDPIPFVMIVDCFRQKVMERHNQTKLPSSISEFSGIGKMFMQYHKVVAKYKYVKAEENLSKASRQRRSNNYGFKEKDFIEIKEYLFKQFLNLFGEPPIIPKRVIKPEHRGLAIQCYGNVKEKTNEFI